MFNYLTVQELHDEVLKHYGGASGIRDNNLLDSALHRPFQTFDSEDLYPSFHEKAAAILQSIIINHPFVDGNKRTGFLLCEVLLMENNLEIIAAEMTLIISLSAFQPAQFLLKTLSPGFVSTHNHYNL